ncbi:MAG: sulfur carrier protein ThiS [Thermomicrobiales bacterium]
MSAPRLIFVLDPGRVPAGTDLPDLAARAAAGGVDAVILRARGESVGEIPALAAALRERIGGTTRLLVNGDIETAAQLGLGVHLPERGSTIAEVRALLGPGAPIGRSVHSPDAAAASGGADYLLAGHVYPSNSHPGDAPLGPEGFQTIAAAAPCPVLAIGGITAARVAEVLRHGAAGVAVIDAIAAAPDPEQAARNLRDALAHADHQISHPREHAMTTSESAEALNITVNGKTISVAAGATIRDFLASKKLADGMAIVERNGRIVPRAAYPETALEAGDVLEVVHAVGGG